MTTPYQKKKDRDLKKSTGRRILESVKQKLSSRIVRKERVRKENESVRKGDYKGWKSLTYRSY